MITATCIEKHRDSTGNIIEYVIKDTQGIQKTVSKDQLKLAITNKQLYITNLKIDNAGRLVDRAPEELKEQQTRNREPQSSDNIQLQEILSRLTDLEKLNQQYLNALKNIHNRQATAQTEHNSIMQQISQADFAIHPQQNIEEKLNNLAQYLLDNSDSIEGLSKKVSELGTTLHEISALNAQNDEASIPMLPLDGKFEAPSNPYDNLCYSEFFDENRSEISYLDTNDKILDLLRPINIELVNSKMQLANCNISVELLNEYKEEIGKANKAYSETVSLYTAQLEDYAGCVTQSQVLGTAADVISSKFTDITGIPTEALHGIAQELSFGMMRIIPGLVGKGIQGKVMKDFKNRQELSKEQASKIFNEINGIWNCAVDFLNTEHWEIVLYAIQTLNHLYLKTYAIGQSYSAIAGNMQNAVKSENGQMKSYIDTSLRNKDANRLTENSLQYLFDKYEERSNVQDKLFEYAKMVYDRFIVSYFAAKQILKKYHKYPFSDRTSPQINGVLVSLTCLGLILTNVRYDIAGSWIGQFYWSNIHKRDYKYQIDTNVDFQTILQ